MCIFVDVFLSTETRLESLWTLGIMPRLLLAMWCIRIKVQALVLPLQLCSLVQMWPFQNLRSAEQLGNRFCVFMDGLSKSERWWVVAVVLFFVFSVQGRVVNTVTLPQVKVCTGGERNNLLHVQRYITRRAEPSSRWSNSRPRGLPSRSAHSLSWKVEWESTVALHRPAVYHSISWNRRQDTVPDWNPEFLNACVTQEALLSL